jgi:hypothetical protein
MFCRIFDGRIQGGIPDLTLRAGGEREGGDGRDITQKNISELMPAANSRYWRQNLKVVAQRAQSLLQDEEQWRCDCAHPERGEAEERERQRRR